uniref:Putative secreted salivary protein n=1 Tax=Aedes albopictus TaxID=7160 RepID=A0A023EG78_AEDAL
MQSTRVISVLLVAILASVAAIPVGVDVDISEQISASIEAVKNVGVFQAGSQNAAPNRLPGQDGKVGQQLVYTLGQRVAGDRLVSTQTDGKQWPTLQDVTLSLAYPQSGVGAVVTYVQVIVKQSSNLGKGYVVSGGIGQRFIHLMIEAYSTTYFNYSVQIFGL